MPIEQQFTVQSSICPPSLEQSLLIVKLPDENTEMRVKCENNHMLKSYMHLSTATCVCDVDYFIALALTDAWALVTLS